MLVDPKELRDTPIRKGSVEVGQLMWHAARPMAWVPLVPALVCACRPPTAIH